LFRKEIYLPFILSISLFLIIGYSSYNHIVLGEEEDSNDGNDNDNNVREEEKEEKEDSNDGNDNDNNVREEEKEEKEEDGKEEEDEVPFILPFTAVPFP
jgi:hypothetical protein